ncbi:unnamed protein product [Laminaria digitata]
MVVPLFKSTGLSIVPGSGRTKNPIYYRSTFWPCFDKRGRGESGLWWRTSQLDYPTRLFALCLASGNFSGVARQIVLTLVFWVRNRARHVNNLRKNRYLSNRSMYLCFYDDDRGLPFFS